MSETIAREEENAKRMFRQTGQLPDSNEGDTELGIRHRTGELPEAGDNVRWHRIVLVSTNLSENDKPVPQADPDLSSKFPLADEMEIADKTFTKDLERYTKIRRAEREDTWKVQEQRLKVDAIVRRQKIQNAHEVAQLQELNQWQQKVLEEKDFRKALSDPSIPEADILAMAAQMPESAVVDYVERTGDIELLVRDPRTSLDTILGVISSVKRKFGQE